MSNQTVCVENTNTGVLEAIIPKGKKLVLTNAEGTVAYEIDQHGEFWYLCVVDSGVDLNKVQCAEDLTDLYNAGKAGDALFIQAVEET
jgi:hypothetical protein